MGFVPGDKVLWYGGDGSSVGGITTENEYCVYNNSVRCSQLYIALTNLGWTMDNTIGGGVDNIEKALTTKQPKILVIPQMELGTAGTGGDPDALPDVEVDIIYEFVNDNGNGLVIMDGNDTDGYNYERVQNKVLKRLNTGIYIQSDVVRDDDNYWGATGNVWQIYADVDVTTSIGAGYQTATGKTTIGLYNVCSLAPKGNYEIGVTISPPYREGFVGGTLIYNVTVINAGWLADNYTLSILDNIWTATLSATTLLNVDPAESRSLTITVNIPSGASIGDNDNIRLRTTSGNAVPTKSVDRWFMATASNRIRPGWEDSGVDENEPTLNSGSEIFGEVTSRDNGMTNWRDARTWMKFDLRAIPSPVSIKPGNWTADTLQARLFAYCTSFYFGGTPGENVRCYMVDNDNWGEMTITWSNQPPLPTDNYTTTKVTREGSAVSVSPWGWYSWDVTQLIREKLKRVPRENFASFCLRAEVEGAAYPDNFTYSFDMMNLPENRYHAYIVIGYDVNIWATPENEEGHPSATLKYRCSVQNTGSFVDNFDLSVAENVWQATLDTATLSSVQPMGIGTATLSVGVPVGATPGVDNDNITVRATSDGYASEDDNYWVIAKASTRITPVEDTSTRARTSLENAIYASATSIYIGRYQDYPQRGWLKFDLRAENVVSIQRARLNLYCYSYIKGGTGAALRVYGVGDSWNEDNLSWSNQSTTLGSPLDSAVVLENGRWLSLDVTSFVTSQKSIDNVVSFCVVDLLENVVPDHAAIMESKEYYLENLWAYLTVESTALENEVKVSVDPVVQGDRGGRVDNYLITVSNKGTSEKTYNLTIENTQTWTWTLDSSSLVVPAGENRTTWLRVTIPSAAAVCTIDNLTITATNASNSSENDVTRCYAHRGEVDFKLGTLYKLRAYFKLYVRDNSGGLIMYFYDYDNVRENAALPPATVWSIVPYNLDNDLIGTIDIPHVGGIGVKKVKLFLVRFSENVMVKGWVIVRDDLWTRIMGIRGEWPYASVPARDNLWKELMAIRGQWPYAPTVRDPVWVG